MSLCVLFTIENSEIKFLGKEYRENYWYSEVTHEDSVYQDTFSHISNYLDEDRNKGITIFRNIENAEKYRSKLQSEYIGKDLQIFVMNFDKLNLYLKKNKRG